MVGDNNFIRQEYGELYKNLDLLLEEVIKSSVLSDEKKLNYQSDIETIKNQLAKEEPNKNILKQAWNGLVGLAIIESIMQFYERVKPLIENLLK